MDEEKARHEFNAAYGDTFTTWLELEDHLMYIFYSVVGLPVFDAAKEYFALPRSLARRIEVVSFMVDQAINVGSHPEQHLLGVYKEFVKKLGHWKGIRDRLAHGHPKFDLRPSSKTVGEWTLTPPRYGWSTETEKKADTKRLTMDNLGKMKKNFAALRALFIPIVLLEQLSEEDLLNTQQSICDMASNPTQVRRQRGHN